MITKEEIIKDIESLDAEVSKLVDKISSRSLGVDHRLKSIGMTQFELGLLAFRAAVGGRR